MENIRKMTEEHENFNTDQIVITNKKNGRRKLHHNNKL